MVVKQVRYDVHGRANIDGRALSHTYSKVVEMSENVELSVLVEEAFGDLFKDSKIVGYDALAASQEKGKTYVTIGLYSDLDASGREFRILQAATADGEEPDPILVQRLLREGVVRVGYNNP